MRWLRFGRRRAASSWRYPTRAGRCRSTARCCSRYNGRFAAGLQTAEIRALQSAACDRLALEDREVADGDRAVAHDAREDLDAPRRAVVERHAHALAGQRSDDVVVRDEAAFA